ncbi:MAG: 2Fe-2S iron-sulfur cluster-binding protein [Planctomycetota bacterium]
MPRVTYITPDGEQVVVDDARENLMRAAVDNRIEGILGDCGGVAACATCHVRVSPDWIANVGPASDIEQGMLDLADEVTELSRLGCQVELTEELDGLIVSVVGR